MRGRSVQSLAVDDQVAIVPDADPFAPQDYQSFDVILPLLSGRHRPDSCGVEDDNLAAPGPAEVIGDSVHEQVIAADRLHADDIVPLLEDAVLQRSTGHQSGSLKEFVRREGHRVSLSTNEEFL